MLTVVLAIARLTARERGSSAFVEKFTQSIEGIAASFLLLVKNEWQGASIFELIRAQIASFGGLFGNQITFGGGELMIRPRAAQALGMAFHELLTNSIKYGALSEKAGRISIRWSIQDPGNQFCMTWSERGGPEPKAPARNGFGNTVIVTAVEGATGGNVRLQYPVSGLVWEVTAPLDQII
jgi:two-component sensor histidine kinase